jgi:predicted dithiol-disulfide oxidoreductase (DUF899 family)
MITDHPIVSHEAWVEARKQHLAREKEFTRLRDQLSAERRAMPWERVETPYVFETLAGKKTLAELFAGRSQLLVQHLMFAPGWKDACKSCSFWADNFNGTQMHLAARDVTFTAVSTAPLAQIEAFKARMGWGFDWVSCYGSSFNEDFHVTFSPDALAKGEVQYNYRPIKTSMSELPGISVFYRDDSGAVFHTYSCYSRGLDMLNGAYHYLDLVPKGRDEDDLAHHMSWVRLHDSYGA